MASSDYLKQYQKAFQKSQGYDINKFAGDLEKAYNEKNNYNKDLIDQQNELQAEQYAIPAQLREEYYQSAIRNPLKQEALISGRQAATQSRLGGVTDLLNARGQQFQDILGKATSAYQTDAQKQQTNAENLWRMYQDAQAQENARRVSASDIAMADYYKTLSAKEKKNNGKPPVEPKIEIDDRSIATKGLDLIGSLGTQGLNIANQLGILQNPSFQKLLQSGATKIQPALTKFLSSGLGTQFIKQSNYGSLLGAYKNKYGLKSQ